jgi:geranylgeranyl reductase family protein
VNKVYDTIIVGAGPAGTTAARLLAEHGANVLLLDKARFPRDKPCGGGVTLRAANEAGVDLSSVVERTIHEVRVSFRGGKPFRRVSAKPLSFMTQRSRLDAHLVEQAAGAGAEFHDGNAVREIEMEKNGAVVRGSGYAYRCRVLVGADGANGVVAKAAGIAPTTDRAVALEGNISANGALMDSWKQAIAIDLGDTPGGYGWLFPKGDHLNVGVGGYQWIGPSLRERLRRLCSELGLDPAALWAVRGHHLPMPRGQADVQRGPVLLTGDAAGFVDPLSGEGIDAAFASSRLAAKSINDYLSGAASDLSGYGTAVQQELLPDFEVSRKLQRVFHRSPRPYVYVMQRSDRFWATLCRFVRGEASYAGLRRKLGVLWPAVDLVARWSEPRQAASHGH